MSEHITDEYRKIIPQLLTSMSATDEAEDIECQLVFDADNDHYLLLDVGWEGLKRVYNCFIHLDIKDGKIWIQRNMTETDLGQALVDLEVTNEDIALGLHSPYKQPYKGYDNI